MVINHLEKLFVTSDAGTILKELEVGTSHRLRQSGGFSPLAEVTNQSWYCPEWPGVVAVVIFCEIHYPMFQ